MFKLSKQIRLVFCMLLVGIMVLSGCGTDSHDEETLTEEESEIAADDEQDAANDVIQAPLSSQECEGKNYEEIQKIFADAGFQVVLTGSELSNEEASFADGGVISVSTEDQATFEQNDEFSKDTVIVINYCVLTESVEPEEVVDVAPAYNITDTTATMYAVTTANVRSEPDKDSTKLGALAENDQVNVTGAVDNGWYRIDYNGTDGFVKDSLLSSEEPFVQKVTPTPSSNNSTNTENTSDSEERTSVTVPDTADTQGNLVWVPTNGGTKYHSKSTCSNMIDPIQVTKEHAEANGYTACMRCH